MRNTSLPNRASILALAIALAAGPSPVAAQSFVGTHSETGATVDQSTPGQTNVTVTQQQAVINWTTTNNPSGGQIVFQPDGTSATFNGASNYAVLNRVTPGTAGNAIYMGGNITSLIGGEAIGGTVFFYSPNGIVIGQNASINVGSLGLTTLPITDDGQGNWMSGFGGGSPQVSFGQATDPNSFVRTNSVIDGSINAFGAGSYVALVAPQVTHNGVIRTDTAAALVAAEAATITFSPSGLFNIQVTTGTDAATGIAVSGTIARNSATEGLFNHRAYLVAVARNDAVTMVINGGGSVGFDTATSASVENNVVVLSGGYNVLAGDHFVTSGVSNVPLTITNSTLSSDVDAQVTGGAAINSGQGALTFGGDLSVISGETTTTGGNALIDGLNGNPLNIAGNLFVRAGRRNADGSGTGLISRLGAEGGSIVTVGGDVELDSDSFGVDGNGLGENGTSATGGSAQVNIGANSTLNVAGSIDVHADGFGGFTADATAGNGTGGQALVMAINGNATITVGGSVFANANGQGGSVFECLECGVTGGTGTGGNASVHTNLGTGNLLEIAGDVWVSAVGQGGGGDAVAGSGIGGTARIGAADNSDLSVGGDTDLDATGFGGYGFGNVGGLGRGGEAGIGTGAGGSIDLTGPVFVIADGFGGDGALGGTGTGRRAYIAAIDGNIHAFGEVFVSAFSEGGFGSNPSGGSSTGGGGIANTDLNDPTHSWASLYAENGTLTIDGISFVTAGAFGGSGFNGGDGGAAIAGHAAVHAGNSDSGPSLVDLGDVFVTAEAEGGAGGDGQGGTNGQDGGDGGSAIGGRVVITAAAGNGELIANVAEGFAAAIGGSGGNGGDGDGGNGGNGGDGGGAEAGLVNIGTETGTNFATTTNDGVATYASIVGFADAFGGDGGSGGFGTIAGLPGNGGDALGGFSVLLVRGSIVNVGDVNLDASAFGGSGGLDPSENPAGTGGDAITGSAGVLATNRNGFPAQLGELNAGTIFGTAFAFGGAGTVAGGQWTQGGSIFFEVVNSDATIGSVNLFALADDIDPNATQTFASRFAVVNGTVDIANDFGMSTVGRVSIHVDDNTPLTQAVTAGNFNVFADNFVHDETRPLPVNVGTIGADSINLFTTQDLIVDAHLLSASALSLFAPGLIDVENAAVSGGDLSLQAGTTIEGGHMTAAGWVSGNTLGNITLLNVNAGDFIDIQSASGDLSLGTLSAVNAIDLNAAGNIGFGPAAADDLDFDAGGAVTGGNIIAGTSAGGTAVGQITLGNVSVGTQQAGGPTDDGFAVGFASETGISVQNVEADEAIGFATLGNLAAGDLNAGTDVMTLIGGNTTIASIGTNPGTGRAYHGDVQMFIDAGGPDNFNPNLVFGATPVRSGGSYSVTGPIAAGRVQIAADSITTAAISAPIGIYLDSSGGTTTGNLNSAGLIEGRSDDFINLANVTSSGGGLLLLAEGDIATGAIGTATGAQIDAVGNVLLTLANVGGDLRVDAGGSLTAGPITAGLIDARVGGLATINGMWSSGDVELWSNDIQIAAGSGIDAGATGSIRLVSTNATQMLIGDGLAGSGYALSNAEFGGLSGGDVEIAGRGDASAAIDMLIGNLGVTGPNAGSTIEDPLGALVFATGDPNTLTAGGVIRITGDLTATGFADTNAIEFYTGRFELDAATGLLQITGTGPNLSGEFYIEADRIHVASGAILDQLAANPQYSGYQEDLNAPAAVQRPDGVIRAGGIDVFPADAVLVQNTGTAATPAGFLTFGDGPLFSQSEPPVGPIELIINGQLLTEGGTLTGVDVLDFLIDDSNLSLFTENSTINGCLLTGSCADGGGGEEPPFPPDFTPTPGIQDEITLIDDELLPPPEFGNEDFIDDNDEETEDGATSPIEPPTPLFDTSELSDAGGTVAPEVGTPMRSSPGLTETGDVDDPVSGSGNPALIETPPPPPTKEEKQP